MYIQKFMDDRGYTQADLAEALGTSQPMTSVEFVDILQEALNNSLESIKRRIEK